MKRTVASSRGPGMAKHLRSGVFLVVLFVFSAWSLRVALLNFDTLSDLTLAGVLNEALRAMIFVGPVFLYLRYVEKAPALAFLRIGRPHASFGWVTPLAGTLFVVWWSGTYCSTRSSGTECSLALLLPWSCLRSCPRRRW